MNGTTIPAASALMTKSYEELMRDLFQQGYTRDMVRAKLDELHQTWKQEAVAARATAGLLLDDWFPDGA